MKHIIGILVEQQPSKIGQHERSCVEESLELSVFVIAKDIKIQQARKGESQLLDVLALVFNRKKSYYKGSKGWNVNHLSGLPEVRLRMIESFRHDGGFAALAEYLSSRIDTPIFPSLELLHQILNAIADAVPSRATPNDGGIKEMEDDAILVGQAAMKYIASISDESMRKLQTDMLNTVRYDLQRIFDRLVSVRREHTYHFYAFWRNLVLLLISSKSLPLRLFGWEQLKELIDASQEHRPPPRGFMVSGAGCTFVNGLYTFSGVTTTDGYSQRGVEISYEQRIPPNDKDGGGKNLTLFRCTMRSQQKWWFLSEADEEQPGTDRDIDYYQHKSKEHEEMEPPAAGWVTCRNAGVEPSPRLQGRGLMVPKGEEYNTLEHQLAKWAIENKIVELVLGASLHREVVHRSIPFIEFLAQMCDRDAPPMQGMEVSRPGPNAFCLHTSHLLLAWKTCTSKSDAAVSDEIYHLLVSILPSLPNALAITLLQAVQESLASANKKEFLIEVSEFCYALASHVPDNLKDPSFGILSEEVRSVILDLLWAVLTHPDASTLKCYDELKLYVTKELRVEPIGRKHREKFLRSCTLTLSKNAQQQQGGGRVDEVLALRMVKLTQFVLEACPRDQAGDIVTAEKGALASLIFSELTAYLARRKEDVGIGAPNRMKVRPVVLVPIRCARLLL
jgi:ubiquitin carboxyl-terminal hydrolase 9/24